MLRGQRPLRLDRRAEPRGGAAERGEQRVALRPDRDSAGPLDCPAKEAVMLAQERRIGVAELLEQPCRAFDVGEQEGDGPGRELGCGMHEVSGDGRR